MRVIGSCGYQKANETADSVKEKIAMKLIEMALQGGGAHLHDVGYRTAETWLQANHEDPGNRSTLDVDSVYL